MGDITNKLLEESELTKLPSLPHILIKLLRACQTDTACFDTLAEIINKDAALSAKVIAVANSPVYGKSRELTSLKEILLYLGLDMIKSIAITASVQQFFSRYSKEKSRFLKMFWEHILHTALIAKSLAKLTSYGNPEEAYLAGLLHDIGKLVFENHSHHEYSVLVHTDNPTVDLIVKEQELFGITHDKIGARLLEIWGLPDVISEAVKYHHEDYEDILEAHHLVKIINLASTITENNNDNSGLVFNYGKRLFDLSDSILLDIQNNSKKEVKKIAASMDIDIGNNDDSELKDEEKQIQLAQEIKDISLTQGSMQLINEDLEGVDYSAIQKSTMILFGINKSSLFVYDQNTNTLVLNKTTAQVNKSILEGIEVKGDSSSIIARTIDSAEIKTYFSDETTLNPPVVDKQIVSAFKTEGIVCIPLIKFAQHVGVIVMGISHAQYNSLKGKMSLLEMFAAEIASRVSVAKGGQKIRRDFMEGAQQQITNKAKKIIHEVNNPLAVIRNYLALLATRLNESDPAQNDLIVISEEIDRVGSIILKCDEDFNALEKINDVQEVDINEIIVSMNNIMLSSLYATHNITSHVDLSDKIGVVKINKNSLKQILTNLIKNSVEAMTDKRELNISTRNINVNGKNYLEIEVKDTGPGLPDKIMNNLYKPVTSTKGKHHSGLGLSIVKNLIDNMKGEITCKSNTLGTTFSIHFPLK